MLFFFFSGRVGGEGTEAFSLFQMQLKVSDKK